MKFQHSTPAQTIAALRDLLRNSRGLEVCRIARWLLANTTDIQLQKLFNVTVSRLPALKARLQAKADRLTAAEDEVGE